MACRVLEYDYKITNSYSNHYNSVIHQKKGWAMGTDIVGLQRPVCNIIAHSKGTVTKVVDYMDGTNLKNDMEGWGFGNYVVILHGQRADGKWLATEYCHLAHINNIKEGQIVTEGQVLGLMGNTGTSYGVHLHWSYRIYSEKPTKANVHNKNIFVWENPEQYLNKDLPLRVVIDDLTDKQICTGKTTEDYTMNTIPNRFKVWVNGKQIGAYTNYSGAISTAKAYGGLVLDGNNAMSQLYP